MATVRPLRGVRFDPGRVSISSVLAPPYDTIDEEQREQLYACAHHNVVRIDYGREAPDDRPGVEDRYSRAAGLLKAWLSAGVLRRDPRPAFYVQDHTFMSAGGRRLKRRGVFARVPALAWERSDVRPHERTLRGPKEDRLRLMRATRTQTSAIFALWDRAPGLAESLEAATTREPVVTAATDGEMGMEEHRLWVVDEPIRVASVVEALRPARLYIADGHHRFETAAAYAAERRAGEPDAPVDADFTMTLLYLCAADDPALEVLPTHRLVPWRRGLPATLTELSGRLGERFTFTSQPDLATALQRAGEVRAGHHAFAVADAHGAGLIVAPRLPGASPRAGLDVSVAEQDILGIACGLDAEQVRAGALSYTRAVDDAAAAVRDGRAALAVCLTGCTTAEILAVSDADETMPQKSTYFHPKVPTGLVLSPA